ncbi:hypothetical protein FSP39_010473 [Pinctada imbricata]|uniref:MAU2 chromatid cohesion factor homolog n=1 Tax=Pinctada imbricata TaxID=66713 RepID=A0AA89C0F7_PINIB|nr:hypothetical protein FSP39_010473 [Pinctada imbricata]
MAETFRTQNPPEIRMAIHCLKAILNINAGALVEAKTNLQIGKLLTSYSSDTNTVVSYLEKSHLVTEEGRSIKCEAANLLAETLCKQNQKEHAKHILGETLAACQDSQYWYCRLLFQLAQIHVNERDYTSACQVLSVGEKYCTQSEYTRLLFLLSKGMLYLINKQGAEVHETLGAAGQEIESLSSATPLQKDSLKVFFLLLQVCHYLFAGQVKSVKPALKNLQQIIQSITQSQSTQENTTSVDQFQWLPTEHMCVLVYLVTVMHSMQAGYIDKAQKYTEKALLQIEKLKVLDTHPILLAFQLMLLENIIMCRLIMGNKTMAIQEIYQACTVCQQQPKLFTSHSAQLHSLLGLYAMSMNCMEAAEVQFQTAAKEEMSEELATFVKLNLAIVYLRMNRTTEFATLMESMDPERSYGQCHSLKASAFYVQGLQAFFQAKYSEAKRYLRETLKMANAEDLNRLTSCSLVLLGQIFMNLGNNTDALNMVIPAMQLAEKIPDVHVQLWASSLLKDLYHISGDTFRESEGYRMHSNFSQTLLKDHLQAAQLSEHQLIQWKDGPFPAHIAPDSEDVK